MYCSTKPKVAAKADRKVVESAELSGYCEQVGEGLRRVGMAAVARIDDGRLNICLL